MLQIKDYSVSLKDSENRLLPVVEALSLHVKKGKCLGIVGESGSGKSVLAMSLIGLVPTIHEKKGSVIFNQKDITNAKDDELRKILGKNIGVIFQEPMTAMNPLMNLSQQIEETVRAHLPKLTKQEVKEKAIKSLYKAGFAEPEKFYNSYPHQLSGGMRQRGMIAMALVLEPELLIADEPTTAIDAELQVHVINELKNCKAKDEQSIIFISHDLGVMRTIADDLAVMYAGCLVEYGNTNKIFENPKHPYTAALIRALPRLITQKVLPAPIPKTMPAPHMKPKGCVFADRCDKVFDKCFGHRSNFKKVDDEHYVACELYHEHS